MLYNKYIMHIRLQRSQMIEMEGRLIKDAGIPYAGELFSDSAHIVVGSNAKPENNPELRGIVAIQALGNIGMKVYFGDFYSPEGKYRRAVDSIGFPRVVTGNGTHSLHECNLLVRGFSLEVDTISSHAIARVDAVDGREFVIQEANLDERNNASGQAFNAAAILYSIESSAFRAIGADAPVH